MLALAALALAVSLDGLGAGSAYGLKGIGVPAVSLALIGLVSSGAAALAMLGATHLAGVLAPSLAARLGAALLLSLGIWLLWQGWEQTLPAAEGPLLRVRVRPLGLIVQVLRDPRAADLDGSGRLEGGEALLLGLGLALDAAAAGTGAALAGWGYLFPLVVGPAQSLMILVGRRLAARVVGRPLKGVLGYLPGAILVALGVARFI